MLSPKITPRVRSKRTSEDVENVSPCVTKLSRTSRLRPEMPLLRSGGKRKTGLTAPLLSPENDPSDVESPPLKLGKRRILSQSNKFMPPLAISRACSETVTSNMHNVGVLSTPSLDVFSLDEPRQFLGEHGTRYESEVDSSTELVGSQDSDCTTDIMSGELTDSQKIFSPALRIIAPDVPREQKKTLPSPCALISEVDESVMLPSKYQGLFELFCALDTVLLYFRNRSLPTLFSELKHPAQRSCDRELSKLSIAQMLWILPGAFKLSYVRTRSGAVVCNSWKFAENEAVAEYELQIEWPAPISSELSRMNGRGSTVSGMNRTSDSGADVNPYIRPAISSPISLSELLQNRRRSFRLRLCQWAFEQKSLVTSSNSIENIEVPDVPAIDLPLQPRASQCSFGVLRASLASNSAKSISIIRALGAPASVASVDALSSVPSFISVSSTKVDPKLNDAETKKREAMAQRLKKALPPDVFDRVMVEEQRLASEQDIDLVARRRELARASSLPIVMAQLDSLFRSRRASTLYLAIAVEAVVDAARFRVPISPAEGHARILQLCRIVPRWLSIKNAPDGRQLLQVCRDVAYDPVKRDVHAALFAAQLAVTQRRIELNL